MYKRKKPLMSIIIPSWFTEDQHGKYGKNETFWFAVECLKRLQQTTDRSLYELIIIDNGSTLTREDLLYELTAFNTNDPSRSPSKLYFAEADILIKNKHNLGFGPACNQGFNVANGEYIVCLNNDVLVWEGWEKAILNVFKQKLEPKVGIVMPALITETSDAKEALKLEKIQTTKNAGKYGKGAEFGSMWVAKNNLLDEIRELNKEEIGLNEVFDENFILGMGEDRKLWQQTRMLGYETYRCHDTRVFHQGNLTIGKVKDRKKYTTKNREYLADWKKKNNLK